MRTTVVTRSPDEAAAFLRSGELVAFPTETVYGLGADALRSDAVAKVFEAKGRPPDNPVIVHIASVEQLAIVARDVTPAAERFAEAFWPGPLTLVLNRTDGVPSAVSGGLETVGVRIPDHALALRFLEACETPVAAPSANRSGRPSPTTADAVLADLGGRIACLLDGEQSAVGLESTVLDVISTPPIVLRAGGVSLERLRDVDPHVALANRLCADDPPRSPGSKYRHYAPSARVLVIDGPPPVPPVPGAAYIGLANLPNAELWTASLVVPSIEAYGRELFRFFRAADAAGARVICCQAVSRLGLGLALMDRIERAASS